jgi:D-2-hydroxyacid dehydrogenase (NADP+)
MKVLLLRTEEPKVHVIEQRHISQIQAVDKNIELQTPLASNWSEVERHLEDAEVVAGFPQELSQISLAQIPHVKWIHSFSAGMEKVLTAEIKASTIIVSNSSGVHAIPIAEHVLGFILLFAKKFHESFANQQQKEWKPSEEIAEIRGATLLVVGLGRIGTEIASVASGAGMRVLAVDRPEKEKPGFVEKIYSADELLQALPEADYVVLSLPHTVETNHLFTMEKFRIMKQSAIIINIGRGGIIHEKELMKALKQNIIGGAGLDVTEEEPLPADSPLWEMENVVITPHHSSRTKQRMDRTINLFCSNIKAYIQGEPLLTLVDKQKGY